MRFQVEAPAMQSAMDAASLPVKRGYIPILQCLNLSAADNSIRFIGTDMDMEAQSRCEASVSEPGRISVDAGDLSRCIKGCKGVVTAALDGDYLRISVTGSDIALPVLRDEFPKLPKPDASGEIEGFNDVLRSLVPFAQGDTQVRRNIAGVCVEGGAAVATNGGRLARFDVSGGEGQIIPSEAFAAILKMMGDSGRFFVGERTWRVEREGAALIGKLVDMQFPPWRRIEIPRNPAISFDAGEMLLAIDRATLGRAKDIFICAQGGELTLSGEKWPDRQIDTKATLRCDGEDLRFLCYTKDLSECVKAFAGSVVEMTPGERGYRFNTPERPDQFTMFGAVSDHRTTLPAGRVA